jgi:hypothetical protein
MIRVEIAIVRTRGTTGTRKAAHRPGSVVLAGALWGYSAHVHHSRPGRYRLGASRKPGAGDNQVRSWYGELAPCLLIKKI